MIQISNGIVKKVICFTKKNLFHKSICCIYLAINPLIVNILLNCLLNLNKIFCFVDQKAFFSEIIFKSKKDKDCGIICKSNIDKKLVQIQIPKISSQFCTTNYFHIGSKKIV